MTHIDPVSELRRDLCTVLNPARYLGGEYGQIIKETADLTFALSFPDLYEIAMSNVAIKLLYDGLNRLPSVRCERVFAPAPDFEALLKQKGLPLYTLETGIPVHEADILGVSIGYEPGITGLLAILDTGHVPMECKDRTEKDPIVLAGGCGITNPAPFSRFIDAFFIGEAEAGLFTLVAELADMKKRGATRSELLAHISAHPAVWTSEKDAAKAGQICARRAVYNDFGSNKDRAVCFPVPSMRVVQDHGAVEIMRGCPNGCRFCHAGMYYRPQRMMGVDRILSDVDYLVNRGGYREISLMSLSSGDYNGIENLLNKLTERFSHKNVSFQLPSLKVNSFTLPLLEKMSEIRKSGLTFAVETPVDAWQLSLNKEVYRDKIVEIMLEAKRRGWSKAKFYFMIGLPVEKGDQHEEQEIVNFLLDIQDRTRIQCNANIGIFIPKPHTPYQWSRQLDMAEADRKLDYIRKALPPGRFKVSTPWSFNAFVEAMMSRGDSRVGEIILEAYKRGCRLDAWDDWAKPEVWKAVISEAPWNVEIETSRERALDEKLPWDGVSLGVTKSFLKREKERSENQQLTDRCEPNCLDSCGVCGTKVAVKVTEPLTEETAPVDVPVVLPIPRQGEATHRVLISFTKKKEAAFVPHLGLVEVWCKAFQRSGLPVVFTEGFNPLPRFEIAQSLALGVSSDNEIASFLLFEDIPADAIQKTLNDAMPSNLQIIRSFVYPLTKKIRREALSKFLWGNRYEYSFYEKTIMDLVFADSRFSDFVRTTDGLAISEVVNQAVTVTVPFHSDRPLRNLISEIAGKPIWEVIGIHKKESLAHNLKGAEPIDFFDAFILVDETSRAHIEEDRLSAEQKSQ